LNPEAGEKHYLVDKIDGEEAFASGLFNSQAHVV
jgi:hypothetical protein